MSTWPPMPDTPAAILGTERSIALARAFLALAALAAVYLDPTEPSRFAAVAYALLLTYIGFSVAALFIGHSRLPRVRTRVMVQVIDTLLPLLLIVFAEGPSSPFFILLPFALLAAAYRWGFRGIVITGAVGVLVLAGDALVIWAEWGPALIHDQPLDPLRFLLRGMYLVVLTVMIGVLAETARRRQSESVLIGELLAVARAHVDVGELALSVGHRLQQLYGARAVAVAIRDEVTARAALWQLDDGHVRTTSRDPGLVAAHLEPRLEKCWQSAPGEADSLCRALGCRSLVACDLRLGEGTDGRLFLLDPAGMPLSQVKVSFLARLVDFAAPAVFNAYLTQRLRSRAVAGERARLAAELHDGVTQSLLGLELQVESYRRTTAAGSAEEERLGCIRDRLRDCVEEVRALTSRLQEASLTARNVGAAVRRMARRLQQESGIEVTVEGFPEVADCTAHGARQLAYIVREALTNVRKHSGATRVRIVYSRGPQGPKLVVEDDGCGFPARATITGPELEACEWAPLVLLSRVKALGGRLTLESVPRAGARLVVEWRGLPTGLEVA